MKHAIVTESINTTITGIGIRVDQSVRPYWRHLVLEELRMDILQMSNRFWAWRREEPFTARYLDVMRLNRETAIRECLL